MKIYKHRSFEEFTRHSERIKTELIDHQNYLQKITPKELESFTVPGYSYTASKQVEFLVDYQHSTNNIINWRERVCCPETYFNNRMRAAFHIFDIEMQCYLDSKVYITEQITPSYNYFKNRFVNTLGSEFIGDKLPYGQIDENGIRNENLCNLTFQNESFDALISLDVLEHIPNYIEAFKECSRVLKSGKKMMWSVPFVPNSYENLIRAKIQNGEVVHIMPPEYHGDPLSDEGVLCFQHFGWKMLDEVRSVGFKDAYGLSFMSNHFGYLGGEQYMFIAIK